MAKNANGLGSMYFDKSVGKWKGSITLGKDENGKQKRKTFTGRTQREVRDKISEFYKKYDAETYLKNSKVTFPEFCKIWYYQYENTVSEATIRVRICSLTNLINNFPKLKDVYVTDINEDFLIKGIREFLNQNGLKEFSEYYRITLRIVLNYAVKMHYLKYNPLDKINMREFKINKRKVKHSVFSDIENELFINELNSIYTAKVLTISNYYYPYFLFLYWTGLRGREAAALMWEDIDFVNNTAYIGKTISQAISGHTVKNSTKTGGDRIIYLHENAVKVLNFLLENKKDFSSDTYLFVQFKDKQKYITHDCIRLRFKELCNAVGIKPVTPHFLRHNFISMLMNKGVPVTVVRELAGHTDLNVTLNTYSHGNLTLMKDALQSL